MLVEYQRNPSWIQAVRLLQRRGRMHLVFGTLDQHTAMTKCDANAAHLRVLKTLEILVDLGDLTKGLGLGLNWLGRFSQLLLLLLHGHLLDVLMLCGSCLLLLVLLMMLLLVMDLMVRVHIPTGRCVGSGLNGSCVWMIAVWIVSRLMVVVMVVVEVVAQLLVAVVIHVVIVFIG